VVSSLVLDDQTLVALDALEDGGLLNGPGTNVRPLLVVGADILLCVRRLPSALPVVCELLEEGSLERSRLWVWLACIAIKASSESPTVNVGFATEVDEDEASAAGSSARTTAAASAAVAPIEKRIVIACCRERAEVL
jgi:hypothetical protein